jgi:hypothetical protein
MWFLASSGIWLNSSFNFVLFLFVLSFTSTIPFWRSPFPRLHVLYFL